MYKKTDFLKKSEQFFYPFRYFAGELYLLCFNYRHAAQTVLGGKALGGRRGEKAAMSTA